MARELVPLTQAGLAELVGAHKDTVARWERGEVDPRGTGLTKLARALGTTVEWLREGGAEKPPRVIAAEGLDLELQVGAARVAEGRGAPYDAGIGPLIYRLRAYIAGLTGLLAELEAREAATSDRAPTAGEIERAREVMEWVEAQKGDQPSSPPGDAPRRRARG